jgi:hypothetical protein
LRFYGDCGRNVFGALASGQRPAGRRVAGAVGGRSCESPRYRPGMRPAAMRPLGVGEILDVAINICLRHAGTLLRLTLGIIIPVQVLSTLISLSVTADDEDDDGLPGSGTLDPSSGDGTIDNDVWIELAGFGLIGLLALFAGVFATPPASEPSARRTWAEPGLARVVPLRPAADPVPAVGDHPHGARRGARLRAPDRAGADPVRLVVRRGSRPPGEGSPRQAGARRSRRLVRGRWWPVFGVLVVGVILAGVITAGLAAVSALVVSGESDSAGRIVADGWPASSRARSPRP